MSLIWLNPHASVLMVFSLLADVVILKNGNEIQGEILREEEDRIVLRFPGGVLELPRKDVRDVRRQRKLDYLLEEGEKQLLRGSCEDAAQTFREALRESPTCTRARQGLQGAREGVAASLERLGRYDEARSAYHDLLSADPSNSRASAGVRDIDRTLEEARKEEEKGKSEIAAGDLEKGIWRLEKVHDRFADRRAELGPILAESLARDGDNSFKSGDWARAAERYLKALTFEPEILLRVKGQFVGTKVRQIEPLLPGGNFERTRELAEQGLELDPASEVLRYYRGLSLEGLGKAREAAEEYLSITGEKRPASMEKMVLKLRRAAEEKLLSTSEISPTAGPQAREVLPGDFRQLDTPRFKILHKNLEVAKEAALVADRAYEKIFRELGCITHLRSPLEIVIFPCREEYLKASGLQSWSGGSHGVAKRLGNLSDHKIHSYQDQPRLSTGVLPHEIAHALLHHRLNYPTKLPLWAAEGFSVLQEPDYLHGHLRRLLDQQHRRKALLAWSDVLSREEYPEARVALFYAQSFSMVEFLVSLEDLEEFLAFLKTLSDGATSIESGLKRHYRIPGLPALENLWLGWFDRPRG